MGSTARSVRQGELITSFRKSKALIAGWLLLFGFPASLFICSIPDDCLLKNRRGYFIARDILPELIAYVHQRDALRMRRQATAQEETACK